MKLKLDENLGIRCTELFRQAGHQVTTVVAQGLCGKSDHNVIAASSGEGRCLVTLDLDFANPLVFDPSEFAGIAVLRLPRKPGFHDLVRAVTTLIHGFREGTIQGRLWIVQQGRIREYQQEAEIE